MGVMELTLEQQMARIKQLEAEIIAHEVKLANYESKETCESIWKTTTVNHAYI